MKIKLFFKYKIILSASLTLLLINSCNFDKNNINPCLNFIYSHDSIIIDYGSYTERVDNIFKKNGLEEIGFSFNLINPTPICVDTILPIDSVVNKKKYLFNRKEIQLFQLINDQNLSDLFLTAGDGPQINVDSLYFKFLTKEKYKYTNGSNSNNFSLICIHEFFFKSKYYTVFYFREYLPISTHSRLFSIIECENKTYVVPNFQCSTSIFHFGQIEINDNLNYISWYPFGLNPNIVQLYTFEINKGFVLNENYYLQLKNVTTYDHYIDFRSVKWPSKLQNNYNFLRGL